MKKDKPKVYNFIQLLDEALVELEKHDKDAVKKIKQKIPRKRRTYEPPEIPEVYSGLPDTKMLSSDEMARIFKCSRNHIHKLTRQGKIPPWSTKIPVYGGKYFKCMWFLGDIRMYLKGLK